MIKLKQSLFGGTFHRAFTPFFYFLASMNEGNMQKMWKKIISLELYKGCLKMNGRQMRRQIDKASQTQLLRGENEATNEPYYIHRKRGKGKESNVSQMTLHPQEIMLCYVLLPPCSLLHPSPLLSWNSPEHSVYTERLGNRCAARVQRWQRTGRFHKQVQVIPRN